MEVVENDAEYMACEKLYLGEKSMRKNYFTNLFKKANIKINSPSCTVNIDVTRLGKKFDAGQDAMKEQLVQDMLKYVPTGDTGMLREDIKQFNENNGECDVVYAYDPNGIEYGHYQHEGVMYADPKTGKGAFYSSEYGFWSRPGVTKEKTTRLLNYSDPSARRAWLLYAAEHDREDVVRAAKEGFRKG